MAHQSPLKHDLPRISLHQSRPALHTKTWLPILFAFVLPLLLVYSWWGGFASVQIERSERGPYTYAYFEHSGSLSKLPDTQQKVWRELNEQGIVPGHSINVLFDDPRRVASGKLRAHTGYLIQANEPIRAPLLRGEISKRAVLMGRVQAAALLAPSKTYQALHDHLKTQNRDIAMPAVELYESSQDVSRVGVFTVEINP